MLGPISIKPQLPAKPTAAADRRDPRVEVDLDATVESDSGEQSVQVLDISTTGAAIFGVPPKLSNNLFVALHIEGMKSREAKVVREFQGGYAVRFREPDPALSPEQISQFRKATRDGY